jgi:N-acetyltransferase 10
MKIDLALSIALDTTQNPNPLMSNQKDVYAANTDAEGRRLVDGTPQLTAKDLDLMGMTVYDVKRLAAYAAHSVEIQVVYDLIPAIAQLYFTKRMVLTPDGNRGVALNISESAVLMGLGLQHKSIHDLATTELDLGTSQTSALIYKVLKSVSEYLQKVLGHAADAADDNMEGSSGAKKKKKLKKKSESEAFDGPPSKVAKTHG